MLKQKKQKKSIGYKSTSIRYRLDVYKELKNRCDLTGMSQEGIVDMALLKLFGMPPRFKHEANNE